MFAFHRLFADTGTHTAQHRAPASDTVVHRPFERYAYASERACSRIMYAGFELYHRERTFPRQRAVPCARECAAVSASHVVVVPTHIHTHTHIFSLILPISSTHAYRKTFTQRTRQSASQPPVSHMRPHHTVIL